MTKKVMLVFAHISLVVGMLCMTFWAFILTFSLVIGALFTDVYIAPLGYFMFYFSFSMGIVFIAIAVILFVLRAKRILKSVN